MFDKTSCYTVIVKNRKGLEFMEKIKILMIDDNVALTDSEKQYLN